ncbi:hypothetical protein COV82_04885 [Candidatus Peregrinibacteria bacterium CG11_big_fil_rev_8_21_14_0_20_46_8]|nr:MAG: hypothetical protein COV82_04885 [Candidatus Peregrinibacteria bacterium CG11_big_fil_rev_8_21_14_0_20_46_8]
MKKNLQIGALLILVAFLAACEQVVPAQISDETAVQSNESNNESDVDIKISSNVSISRGDVKIIIEKDASTNRVVLTKDGKESVLYSGDRNLQRDGGNLSNLKIFSNLRLDARGKYLLFTTGAYEHVFGTLYDIEQEEEIAQFSGTDRFGFTPDNRYVYACAANAFSGEYYGEVIDLESQEKVFEIPEGEIEKYMSFEYDIACSADEDSTITFTVSSLNSRGELIKVEEIFTYPN